MLKFRGEIEQFLNLAVAAHLVALAQALFLGGTHGLPGHDEITQGHVHFPVAISLT